MRSSRGERLVGAVARVGAAVCAVSRGGAGSSAASESGESSAQRTAVSVSPCGRTCRLTCSFNMLASNAWRGVLGSLLSAIVTRRGDRLRCRCRCRSSASLGHCGTEGRDHGRPRTNTAQRTTQRPPLVEAANPSSAEKSPLNPSHDAKQATHTRNRATNRSNQ